MAYLIRIEKHDAIRSNHAQVRYSVKEITRTEDQLGYKKDKGVYNDQSVSNKPTKVKVL